MKPTSELFQLLHFIFYFVLSLLTLGKSEDVTVCFDQKPIWKHDFEYLNPLTSKNIIDYSTCAEDCGMDANCYSFTVQSVPNSKWNCTTFGNFGYSHTGVSVEDLVYYQKRIAFSSKTINVVEYDTLVQVPSRKVKWPVDCNTNVDGLKYAMVGLSEDETELSAEIDIVFCETFGGDLEFSLDESVTRSIRNSAFQGHCNGDHVVTAIWDDNNNFDAPKYIKCSPLKNGWKIDMNTCENLSSDVKYLRCSQFPGIPNVVIGVFSNPEAATGIDGVKCCMVYKS